MDFGNMSIELTVIQKRDVSFGAGVCFVSFGGRTEDLSIACVRKHEDGTTEQRITIPSRAPWWLVERGLGEVDAVELVAQAIRSWKQKQPRKEDDVYSRGLDPEIQAQLDELQAIQALAKEYGFGEEGGEESLQKYLEDAMIRRNEFNKMVGIWFKGHSEADEKQIGTDGYLFDNGYVTQVDDILRDYFPNQPTSPSPEDRPYDRYYWVRLKSRPDKWVIAYYYGRNFKQTWKIHAAGFPWKRERDILEVNGPIPDPPQE